MIDVIEDINDPLEPIEPTGPVQAVTGQNKKDCGCRKAGKRITGRQKPAKLPPEVAGGLSADPGHLTPLPADTP